MVRKSLSEILAAGGVIQLRRHWDEAKPADDYGKPLPRGEYLARIVMGELFNSRVNHTPGYKITFEIAEGEYAGRRIWHDIWLSEAALPRAKRDLGKLGITAIDQLEQSFPAVIRCRVKLALQKDDDGSERNRVVNFEVLGFDTPELDPFATSPENDASANAVADGNVDDIEASVND